MAYTKYSLTPANNTAAPPDGAPEGMLPSAVNDTMRDMMAQIRDVGDGVRDGTYTMTAPKITGGTITGVTLTGNTLTNPVITGATLTTSAFNGTVGATTASTGAFTTLSTSSTTTFSGLTASTALALDASKNVVSVTNTGTGNNVLSASPTLTGTIAGASLSLSSLTSGRVTYAGASGLLSDSANLTFDGTKLTSAGLISTGALNVSGSGWGVLPYVANSLVVDSNAGETRLFATGTNASTHGNYLFYTGTTNGTASERMRITSAGLVGIGTSSPARILELKASQSAMVFNDNTNQWTIGTGSFIDGSDNFIFYKNAVGDLMRLTGSGNLGLGVTPSAGQGRLQVAGSSTSWFKFYDSSAGSNYGTFYQSNGSSALGYIGAGGGAAISGGASTDLVLRSEANLLFASGGNSEKMRIDSSGNVGINTTNPDYGSYGATERILGVTGVATNRGRLSLQNTSTGTSGVAGTIAFFNGSTLLASLDVNADGATNKGLYAFNTNNGTSVSERMRIDSSGNLGVGTTTANSGITLFPSFSSSGSSGININHVSTAASGEYYVVFQYNASVIGYISQNGTTAVAYNTTSDYRLKENIVPMTGALATVAQLKPVTYKWKTDGLDGQGFIAHELQAVVPDCVTGKKDAVDVDGKPVYQGVDTSFLVATLTAAIQEQQALIESLTTRLTALENK